MVLSRLGTRMEILSKEIIALLDNEEIRKALDELKDKVEVPTREVEVPRRAIHKGGQKQEDSTVTVTLRRLSA